MSKNAIAVRGANSIEVIITAEGIAERQSLLETAGFIVTVSNAEEQDAAAKAAGELKAFVKAIESSREELKRPILDAGRTLDATAKDASAPVLLEIKRIEGLLAEHHKEQERLRREEIARQEKIAAEARRKQEEADRAERQRLQEIENRRLAAEREVSEAKTKKAREAAQAEAQRLAEEQKAEELAKEFEEPEPAPVFVAPVEVVKAKGAATKEEIIFEVVDIKALYAARPELVELKPREQAIKYVLKTPGIDLDSLPGVRAWKDTVVVTRSAARPASLAE